MADTYSPAFQLRRDQIAAFAKDPKTVRDIEALERLVTGDIPSLLGSKVDEARRINTAAGQLTGGNNLSADLTLGLADTSVSPGSYGDSSHYPTFTVDEFGRLTAAAQLSLPTVQSLLDGISSTRGSILYRGAAGWAALGPGASGQVLQANGTGADPSWANVSSGGGGGSTPTVRNSTTTALASVSSTSVTWPSGTVAGDAVVIFAAQGFAVSVPSGWSSLCAPTSISNWNGAVFGKVMTSSDITAGSVTISFGGSFNGVVSAVTITGSSLSRYVASGFTGSTSGATSATELVSGILSTDLVLCFASTRASTTCAVTGATLLSSQSGTNASACVDSLSGSSAVFGLTVANTFGASGTGYYVAACAFR